MDPTPPRANFPLAAKIVFGLALASLIIYVAAYGYPIAYADHWDTLEFVINREAGRYDIGRMFGLHDAHWHASGYAVNFALTDLFGFNARNDAFANVALGALTALIAMPMAANTASTPFRSALAASVAAAFILSLDQASNWLWAFQTALFMSTFGAVAFAALATGQKFGWLHLLGMMAAAAAGIYGFATAFVLLPLGMIILAFRIWRAAHIQAARPAHLAAWTVFCGAIAAHYVMSVAHRAGETNVVTDGMAGIGLFEGIGTLVMFVLVFVGANISGGTDTAALIALIISLPCFVLAYRRTVAAGERIEDLLPILTLMAIGIGMAGLIGIGRMEHSYSQGAVSRYLSFSQFFWLGAALWFIRVMPAPGTVWRSPNRLAIAAMVCLSILGVAKIENTVRIAGKGAEVHAALAGAAEQMRADYPLLREATMEAAGRAQNMKRAQRHIDYLAMKGWPPFDRPVSDLGDDGRAE
ncbi:MAG: hypothetical protein AAGA24_01210 [Pseudomonadota bacterium]